eukprot:2038555-Rhodomonas_salina.2
MPGSDTRCDAPRMRAWTGWAERAQVAGLSSFECDAMRAADIACMALPELAEWLPITTQPSVLVGGQLRQYQAR